MSKVLVTSDIHIHQHKKSSDRLNHCLDALQWIFETAIDRNIKDILFLGDLFHDRQKLDTYGYVKTYDMFEKYLYEDPKFNMYLLVGNHDMYYFQRWDVSSVKPLRAFPTVTVIEKPSTIKIGDHFVDFLPYTHDPIGDLNTLKSPSHELLCAHIAVDGAKLNLHHSTKSEVCVEHDGDMKVIGSNVYADWDQVFLGHYHGPQNVGINAEYVGSPLQLSFGEAFEDKHIIIYDLQTKKKEYIKNDFSPQHFIIPASERSSYDLNGNYVKLLTDNLDSADLVDLRKELENDVATLEIKPILKKEEEHIIEDAKAILYNKDEMLQKYVEEVEKNNGLGELNKEKLINIGNSFCNQ